MKDTEEESLEDQGVNALSDALDYDDREDYLDDSPRNIRAKLEAAAQ